MKYFIGIFAVFSVASPEICLAQFPTDVVEATFKVGGLGEEVFYYGFAAGDVIVFNFEEMDGKEMKEVEIIEYPSSSKFMDYKSKKIKDKMINVTSTAIYKFRFSNSAILGRICKYKIQRIPDSEKMRNFNTSVYWSTVSDTSFYTENEKYLISKDSAIIPVITHKVERVHSETATNGKPNKSIVEVILPANTKSWSYYLGVGEDAEAVFRNAEKKAQQSKEQMNAVSSITEGLASFDPSGSMALASLLLKGYAEFGFPNQADNIQYWFANDYQNAHAFMSGVQFYQFENGNGPLATKRMTSPLKGSFYICLKNDNFREGIDVHIRISALTVKENWGDRQVQKYRINTRQEPYLKN